MVFFALAAVILFILYVLMLQGRRGHPGWEKFESHLYAHRGLHNAQIPENSPEAFSRAFSLGYGAELDLHLLKDGSIAVLHDSDLFRMTGKKGFLEELTAEDLKTCFLKGTVWTIPTLEEVLSLCHGRVPLILELKTRDGNSEKLTESVCRILDHYSGPYCLESFDPRCIRWLKLHRPHVLRGQLAENFLKKRDSQIPWILRFFSSFHMESFLTKPDFIAHKYCDRHNLSTFLIRKFWHIHAVTWTVETREELDRALKEGYLPIFEGFLPSPPVCPDESHVLL